MNPRPYGNHRKQISRPGNKEHAKLPPAAELNLEQILSNAKRKLRKMKDINCAEVSMA